MILQLQIGDCLELLSALPDACIGAVVSDPPYGLEFMGKEWDSFLPDKAPSGTTKVPDGTPRWSRIPLASMHQFQEWHTQWLSAVFRVCRPGAPLRVFGAPRTFHRLAPAVLSAGFHLEGVGAWAFGSGFPKNYDVARSIDALHRFGGSGSVQLRLRNGKTPGEIGTHKELYATASRETRVPQPPVTAPEALPWTGFGTALKPSWEPMMVGRKPL